MEFQHILWKGRKWKRKKKEEIFVFKRKVKDKFITTLFYERYWMLLKMLNTILHEIRRWLIFSNTKSNPKRKFWQSKFNLVILLLFFILEKRFYQYLKIFHNFKTFFSISFRIFHNFKWFFALFWNFFIILKTFSLIFENFS